MVMITLRIPAGLRAVLRSAAKDDHRSVNGLVVTLLQRALLPPSSRKSDVAASEG